MHHHRHDQGDGDEDHDQVVAKLERRNKRLSRVNGRAKTSVDGLAGAVGKAGIAFAAFRGAQAMISFSKEAIMASATATETR